MKSISFSAESDVVCYSGYTRDGNDTPIFRRRETVHSSKMICREAYIEHINNGGKRKGSLWRVNEDRIYAAPIDWRPSMEDGALVPRTWLRVIDDLFDIVISAGKTWTRAWVE